MIVHCEGEALVGVAVYGIAADFRGVRAPVPLAMRTLNDVCGGGGAGGGGAMAGIGGGCGILGIKKDIIKSPVLGFAMGYMWPLQLPAAVVRLRWNP